MSDRFGFQQAVRACGAWFEFETVQVGSEGDVSRSELREDASVSSVKSGYFTRKLSGGHARIDLTHLWESVRRFEELGFLLLDAGS